MSVFNFDEMQAFGRVQSVDTATVIVQVEDTAQLSKLQVNHLVAIRASKVGQVLIGMVSKIMRKYGDELEDTGEENVVSTDIVKAMVFSQAVIQEKTAMLEESGHSDLANEITLDSPVPYRISKVIEYLDTKNKEMVPGSNGHEKQGDFFGKLSRFLQRLMAKGNDKRLNFMFSNAEELLDFSYMEELCKRLMAPASQGGGIKILDFSEVPSDILPLMVSLLARIVFSVQQWADRAKLNPLAIFCDEAHLYIPANAQQGVEASSLQSFERIAKEGRKYGVGLVIVSQRPSEVNRTVLDGVVNKQGAK